jgi:uncharacterized membrane protein
MKQPAIPTIQTCPPVLKRRKAIRFANRHATARGKSMSEQLTRRFRLALAEEVKQWQKDEVISPEVAVRLSAMYPAPPYDSKLISIALVAGATMLGLSSLTFVSTNWEHINRIVKIVMTIGAMLAAYICAWHFSYEPGKSPRLGGAFIELGTLLFGACIWMVTQFLNFDTNLSSGLLYWAIGTALVTIVTRSQITCCLLILQLVSLQMVSCDIFSYGADQFISLYIAVPTLLALIWLCARVRSRVALFLTLASAIWAIGVGSGTHWAGMVALGSAMVSAYFLWKDRWEWFASPFLYLGAGAGLVGMLCMSFDSSLKSDYNLAILFGLATVPLLFAGLVRKSGKTGIVVSFLFALLACASEYALAGNEGYRLISSITLFFILAVTLTVTGVKLEKVPLTYTALGLAGAQILFRFCGVQIDSMLMRSIAFASVGVIVLLSGAIAEYRRRKHLIHSPS